MIFDFLKESVMVYRLGIQHAPLKKKLRVIRYVFFRHILKKRIPLTAIFGVTYKCQCNCQHCSVGNYHRDGLSFELSTDEIKNCIDEIASLGCLKINFFGGEPLLRDDIVDLVRHASKNNLYVFIDTNGLLLDKLKLKELKEAGLSCVLISLDSSSELKHDASRGKNGLYKKVVESLTYCKKEKIPCVISTIATRDSLNSGDLKKLIKLASDLKVTAVRILLPMLSGKWDFKKELLLNEEEKNTLFKEYLKPGFVYLESGFSYKRARFNKIKCSAAEKELIYISPYGDTQPCYTLPQSFGNIRERSFKLILRDVFDYRLNRASCGFDCLGNEDKYQNLTGLLKEDK